MYCPSCGSELTSELSYCNRCGANLKPLSNQSDKTPGKLGGAAWAISLAVALVTLGGFGMLFSLVMVLISNGINLSGSGMMLIVFSLVIILAIVTLLIRQLSRVLDVSELLTGVNQSTHSALPKPGKKPIQQIDAPREPVSSVTEHTTQVFEPLPRDRET